MPKSPKVFISYSHVDNIFEQKMLSFANKLRSDGIDADIDLYNPVPFEGWPRWMEKQILNSDYIIVVCSESYWNKIYNSNGKGVIWEVNMVYQMLYDEHCNTSKFIPVFWNEDEKQYVLQPLKPYTHYNIGTEEGYQGLWRHILNIPKYQKPSLGEVDETKYEPLPEKKGRTMFFSTPINLELWDAARWKGVVYMLSPDDSAPPVVGFLYRDYEAAKEIFKEWMKNYEDKSPDDYMKITYIVPPLPKDCYVNFDPEKSFGKGYFVHIGVNADAAVKRAMESGIEEEHLLLTFISRYIWVDEMNGSIFREGFLRQAKKFHQYTLIPIGMKDENRGFSQDNLIIEHAYCLHMKNVDCKRGIDIGENDDCKAVLTRANGE